MATISGICKGAALAFLFVKEVLAGAQAPVVSSSISPCATTSTSSSTHSGSARPTNLVLSASSIIAASSYYSFCLTQLHEETRSIVAIAYTTLPTTTTIKLDTVVTEYDFTTSYTVQTTAPSTRPLTTIAKRAPGTANSLQTPAALTKFPSDIISTACAQFSRLLYSIEPVTVVRTQTYTVSADTVTQYTSTSTVTATQSRPVATSTVSIVPVDCGIVAPLRYTYIAEDLTDNNNTPSNTIFNPTLDCTLEHIYKYYVQLGSPRFLGGQSYAVGINQTSGLGVCTFYTKSARDAAQAVDGRLAEVPAARYYDDACEFSF